MAVTTKCYIKKWAPKSSHTVWKWKVSYGRWANRNKISIKMWKFFILPSMIFFGKSIGACAYSAFIIDSWINIEHILWYIHGSYDGKREREREMGKCGRRLCVWCSEMRRKKHTHTDTKPIYAAEGYKKQ